MLPISMIMVLETASWACCTIRATRKPVGCFRFLSVRLLLVAAISNSESCLVALGHPKYSFIQNVFRLIAIIIGIPLGWELSGIKGVIWAVALSEIPALVVIWTGMLQHRMFSVAAELRSLLFVAVGATLGLGVLHFWR